MITKTSFLSLLFVILGLVSCKPSQSILASEPETGLYKIAIFYPNGNDKTFDMDYYENKHMPMVAKLLGKNLKFYEIDKGISGRTPNDKATYVAIGYFYCYDAAEYGKAISQSREAILVDFKNYTNIQPVVQISQIKRVVSNNGK